MVGINPFIPMPNNGGWKLERKKHTKAELNEFITKVMNRIINDGRVTLNAEPPKIPRDVFQHTDIYGSVKVNGFHIALQIDTQRLLIGLRYEDYKKEGMTENQIHMAIRVDVEKIVELFDDLELSKS